MSGKLLRAASLLILLASLLSASHPVLAAPLLPPLDMFQLPWEQGKAWVAYDGFDNGTRRHLGSPHNYLNGGAIDFAPHPNMKKGEDTSNAWVTATAAGTVVEISKCHLKIAHANGWISEYQHLAVFQVKLGDVVSQNQKLAVIANASSQPVCLGSVETDIPHLHFALRPNMVGATFAGWLFKYNSLFNITTFTRDGTSLGLFKPILNAPSSVPTSTPPPSTGIPPTPTGPYVQTEVNPGVVSVGGISLVSVSLKNVPSLGFTSAEFTCTYNAGLVEVSNIVVSNLFGADSASAISGPQNGSFILAVAGSQGNKATTDGIAFTFNAKGLADGQTGIACSARVSQGNNLLVNLPSIGTSLTILGSTPTPPTTPTPGPSSTPVFTATPPPVPADWLAFTNITYSFEFKYPPQGVITPGGTDGFTRINLPIVPGTTLYEKYLEMVVQENVNPCQSPLPTNQPPETVTINGISFLKQTGMEGAAGSLYQWVAYSTLRDTICVSLDFILHFHDPGMFATPPPVFDYDAETAVFGQIVATYAWLALVPTATPVESLTPTVTQTSTPIESPTPTFTSTPIVSPTATPISGAVLTGQVIATKVVTVRVYDPGENFVAAVNANPDGTFRFDLAPGSYTLVATANGFLRIQGSITLAAGDVRSMPVIALLAGDIDDNNSIDQFDAMTIGFSYGGIEPPGADLNNDGIINVLDLELLAKNYRKTGPVPWQ